MSEMVDGYLIPSAQEQADEYNRIKFGGRTDWVVGGENFVYCKEPVRVENGYSIHIGDRWEGIFHDGGYFSFEISAVSEEALAGQWRT